MLHGTTPTLLFYGGEYAKMQELQIQDIFPVPFLFGRDGINDRRRNSVSPLKCLKHYMRLSLPHLKRPDFVLAVCSMYHRIKSFTTGFITCKSMLRGQSLAEQVSLLSADYIADASKRAHLFMPQHVSTASKFLQAVFASCKPLGHSNEAAADARKKVLCNERLF